MLRDFIVLAIGGAGVYGLIWSIKKLNQLNKPLHNAAQSHVKQSRGGLPVGAVYVLPKEEAIRTIVKELSPFSGHEVTEGMTSITVDFKKLCRVWGAIPDDVTEKVPSPPVFLHVEFKTFYSTVSDREPFAGTFLLAIETLLRFLDENGDCSSLPQGNEDGYKKQIPPEEMELFCRVPLWQHSLNVASEVLRLTADTIYMAPTGVICALAHDLGKVPGFYDIFRTYGGHPNGSLAIIEGMPEVRGLYSWKSVKEAVSLHHQGPTSDPICKLIIKANKAARQRELHEQQGD
jgi:hypothetical protein